MARTTLKPNARIVDQNEYGFLIQHARDQRLDAGVVCADGELLIEVQDGAQEGRIWLNRTEAQALGEWLLAQAKGR